jgi:hypothetical protein
MWLYKLLWNSLDELVDFRMVKSGELDNNFNTQLFKYLFISQQKSKFYQGFTNKI